MNKQIRRSKFTKFLACYLAMMILLQITAPMQAYALTEGPSQPEFNSFTPIGTSDMVDLASGDFNYNIPIMDVGGYPINLAYNSGVTMDQEASWVGLGWNLNVGQINRNVRGLPDDFKGDVVETDNNLRDNVTVGVNPYLNAQLIGFGDAASLNFGAGLDVQYNNYSGMSAIPSFGPTFKFSDYVSVGVQLSSSVDEGASVTPSVSISSKKKEIDIQNIGPYSGSHSSSLVYNSRQGLQTINLSSSASYMNHSNTSFTNMMNYFTQGTATANLSFVNNTFTPTKRLAFRNNSFRFSFSAGPDVWGGHLEISIAGYASVQKLVNKKEFQRGYGYENTEFADGRSILDFNREKEQTVITKNTLVLPVTNYTHDLYTIQGHGSGGMFRPFRGQVGHVYDPYVEDESASLSAGVELEVGGGFHMGLNFRTSNSSSHTGSWNTVATRYFEEKLSGNKLDYERIYYKGVGENKTDREYSTVPLLKNLADTIAITLKIDRISKHAVNIYQKKILEGNESSLDAGTTITSQIKRENREQRNQSIQRITKGEAKKYSLSKLINYNSEVSTAFVGGSTISTPIVPDHHTAAYIVTDQSGNRSIYGETVINKEKKEVTFNVGDAGSKVSKQNGLVKYGTYDNTSSNNKGRDHYFNSVKTPAYAHTYLISSVLSPDFQDRTDNGPTDDDLGSYTKFLYQKNPDYKWRVPYGKTMLNNSVVNANVASYNEGFKTDKMDQKGSYLYGIRENKYLNRIETKTHVAFIDLEERRDGMGVNGENGGGSTTTVAKMYRIKSIRLYSKPEAIRAKLMDNNPDNDFEDGQIYPIKTAHFEYDYSQCPNIDNNSGEEDAPGSIDLNESKGKLTLRKVYFTYAGSKMGKYTPYVFDYDNLNPEYNPKAYDIWGNFKPYESDSWEITSTKTTPQEFPYVEAAKYIGQTNILSQDTYASAWTLSSIKLPSGGKIEIECEADDYKYVQDKRAMQMIKVDGVTDSPSEYTNSARQAAKDKLYDNGFSEARYIAVKLPGGITGSSEQVIRRYTENLQGKSIYFNFLLNITASDYDFVTGYFVMDKNVPVQKLGDYLFIPMEKVQLDGKSSGSREANPITVAGCFFGRQNVNHQMNGRQDPAVSLLSNILDIGKDIWRNLDVMSEMFVGANGRLKGKHVGRNFMPHKSWIRLLEPTGTKIGGGCRVKSIVLRDQWDKMLDIDDESGDLPRYAKQYGQEYDYSLDDGTSSGVATYEPNICKENPLIMPFYHLPEKLLAQSYQEEPFGESFFPAPVVTYSKVTVSNINASNTKKTGKIVTQHYTSRDFPTKTDFTNLKKSSVFNSNEQDATGQILNSLLGLKLNVKTDLTMSQGFLVETNDMNGKLKMQEIYDNSNSVISSVKYNYSSTADGTRLNNKLPTIDENGKIEEFSELATTYDVINDFRESYSNVSSFGLGVNTDMIPLVFIPLIIGFGTQERSENKQILRTAVTTKVIHRSGILIEKVAEDLGSTISTRYQAWDAKTGQVVLSETINEFDDKYYTFNYPAYWHYKQMGMASENTDVSGYFVANSTQQSFFDIQGLSGVNISNYLKPGDEVFVNQFPVRKLWVNGYNASKTAVSLVQSSGQPFTQFASPPAFSNLIDSRFKVYRSGNRNMQMASMSSITLMVNPIRNGSIIRSNINDSFLKKSNFDPKVINASAVEYGDLWDSQCENNLPHPGQIGVNNYLYNIRGNYRAVRSYAFLTGRNSSNTNTRKSGFFTAFNPFYKRNTLNTAWVVDYNPNDPDANPWTYASEVTKYNPFGVEIENMDALGRFSAAQYGYQYKLPVAVASNSTYAEMGFDGFEDYNNSGMTPTKAGKPHFGFNQYLLTLNSNSFVTSKTSHTGKRSMEIAPNKEITMKRKIKGCE